MGGAALWDCGALTRAREEGGDEWAEGAATVAQRRRQAERGPERASGEGEQELGRLPLGSKKEKREEAMQGLGQLSLRRSPRNDAREHAHMAPTALVQCSNGRQNMARTRAAAAR